MEDLKLINDKPIEIYTLSDAAKKLKVGSDFLKKGIDDGTLKYVKNGSRTYVTAKALENFFQCCRFSANSNFFGFWMG